MLEWDIDVSSFQAVKMLENIVTVTFYDNYEMTTGTVIFALLIIICVLLFRLYCRARPSHQDVVGNTVLKVADCSGECSKELQLEKFDSLSEKHCTAETGELSETLGVNHERKIEDSSLFTQEEMKKSSSSMGMPLRKKNTSCGRLSTTGELYETQAEITVNWKLKDFFPLPDGKHIRYDSPPFYFLESSYKLVLSSTDYETKESDHETEESDHETKESEEWIEVFLYKESSGYPVTLKYTFRIEDVKSGFEYANWFVVENEELHNVFYKKGCGWGWKKCMLKSEMVELNDDECCEDVLVICTLKCDESIPITRSFYHRIQDIIDNLKEIFDKEIRTDCKLIFNDGIIPAHRVILETRCPVFASLFSHSDKENKTGEICIENIQMDSMEAILEFIYFGDMIELTIHNALPIYTAADKFDIKDIKGMCSDFIIRNLSNEWVCDVIKFAELYNEEEIGHQARKYFRENASKILERDEWLVFAEENHDIGVELLSSVVKALLPK